MMFNDDGLGAAMEASHNRDVAEAVKREASEAKKRIQALEDRLEAVENVLNQVVALLNGKGASQ